MQAILGQDSLEFQNQYLILVVVFSVETMAVMLSENLKVLHVLCQVLHGLKDNVANDY